MTFGRNIRGLQRIVGIGALMGMCALGTGRGYASEEENHEGDHPRKGDKFNFLGFFDTKEGRKQVEDLKRNREYANALFRVFDKFCFTAGGYRDINANGVVDWDEIEGICKFEFRINEKIIFGVKMRDYGGKSAKFKLADEDGNVLDEKELKFEKDSCILYNYKAGTLKSGKYIGIWKVEGLEEEKKTTIQVRE